MVTTVDEYLSALPEDRRETIQAVRATILANLDSGFEEGIQYGSIGYYVPHSVYPKGYHCDPKQPMPFANLANQKNYISLHLMCLYGSQELLAWFEEEFKASGKKLNMGKACVRFKKLDDLPLNVIAELFRRVTARKYLGVMQAALDSRVAKGPNVP